MPISAIEHFSYCPRQCALIHVEGTFQENSSPRFVGSWPTNALIQVKRDCCITEGSKWYDLCLWCERLGLRGKADAVEFPSAGRFVGTAGVGNPHGPTRLISSVLRHYVWRRCHSGVAWGTLPCAPPQRVRSPSLAGRERKNYPEIRACAARPALCLPRRMTRAARHARCFSLSAQRGRGSGRLRGLQGAPYQIWDTDQPRTRRGEED